MSGPAVQDWFTARELAEYIRTKGLKRFPTSEHGMREFAKRRGWQNQSDRYTRQRKGAGRPAQEYHITILPERVRNAMIGDRLTASALASKALALQTRQIRKFSDIIGIMDDETLTSAIRSHRKRIVEALERLRSSNE